MNGKRMHAIVAAAALITLAAAPALAEVTVLELAGVPAMNCDETWTENGAILSFTSTTAQDCDGGGNCYFGIEADAVWLYPCRLNIDFGAISNVTSVVVDVVDYCGVDCTRAFLYDGATTVDSASNVNVSSPDVLVLDANGETVDHMAVSSCEGMVMTITITHGPVATESTTWSAVKSLY